MGVTNRFLFGIHSISPYARANKLPYGMLEVIGGGNLELTAETEKLFGGSSRYAYASEPTQVSTTLTANVKSYPNFLMELFLGGSVTSIAAAASGEVRDFANVKGTSAKHATTGVASVSGISGDSADMKFGKYVMVVLSGGITVDLYLMSNIDFNRGTNVDFLTDGLKVASAVAVTSGGDTNIADFGIKITGGSGTIGMVEGDTAEFDVLPPHTGASKISVGSSTSEFPEFGAFMLASKGSDKSIFQIEAFRCVGAGMPIPLQEKAFAISDLTIELLRDSSKDKVFEITALTEVS